MRIPVFLSAAALMCALWASPVLAVSLFTDGFESYNLGGLDANLSGGPNQAPNGGPGNPWFGLFPPNGQVVTAEHGVTPHSGNQMVRGKNFSGAADGDQNWLNIAYRYNNGQPFANNVGLDYWFYDVNGQGDANVKDYMALGYYNTAGTVPYTQDYPAASNGNLNTGVTQIERLSLGMYNGGSGWDTTKYQARVVGATDGSGLISNGWYNLPITRSVGWHHARIAVGADDLVSFYIDDMNTPLLTHAEVQQYGFNVLEMNLNTGTQTAYFDDVSLTPEPASLLLLAVGLWPFLHRRR